MSIPVEEVPIPILVIPLLYFDIYFFCWLVSTERIPWGFSPWCWCCRFPEKIQKTKYIFCYHIYRYYLPIRKRWIILSKLRKTVRWRLFCYNICFHSIHMNIIFILICVCSDKNDCKNAHLNCGWFNDVISKFCKFTINILQIKSRP